MKNNSELTRESQKAMPAILNIAQLLACAW